MTNFEWLKIYTSPFKMIIPKLYIGKIAIGTPYFYPRRWVKYTYEDALKKAKKDSLTETHPNFGKDPVTITNNYLGYRKAIPKSIGFDFISLGYKTKWDETDFRCEWSPIWSFVFFKWQIALMFIPKQRDMYWECYLNYYYNTDTTKSKKQRLMDAMDNFPCIWISQTNNIETHVNYWHHILKKKYHNYLFSVVEK